MQGRLAISIVRARAAMDMRSRGALSHRKAVVFVIDPPNVPRA